MSTETFKKLPGVLSFQRGLIVTDALFFNRIEKTDDTVQVDVVRHGIRGTQNVNSDADKDTSNIQITDTAKTDPKATGIIVKFSLRFLPLKNSLFACAGKDPALVTALRTAVGDFIARAEASPGLSEVANRYARNLLNGRWLWRNRSLAKDLVISIQEGDTLLAQVNAFDVPLDTFGNYSHAELEIGRLIANSLTGMDAGTTFQVKADLAFGFTGAVEVFPSQNYIDHKPKGFARPLYKVGHAQPLKDNTEVRVMGQAALRDQKISNAIRTIDTWYPDYATHARPLPVEPQGASLDAQAFFRRKKNADGAKVSAFDLVRRINLVDPATGDGQFLIASLLRGGVFSESEKSDTSKTPVGEDVSDEA